MQAEIEGTTAEIRARHNMLTNKMDIWVDGCRVPVRLVRKAFSGLFRYQFDCYGRAMEIRLEADSLRSDAVTLTPIDAPIAKAAKDVLRPLQVALARGCGGALVMVALHVAGVVQWSPGAVISIVAMVLTTLLCLVVCSRR